jgi:hypothetical protein
MLDGVGVGVGRSSSALKSELEKLRSRHVTATASKALQAVDAGLSDKLMPFKIACALGMTRVAIEVLKSAGSDSINMPDWVVNQAMNIDALLESYEKSPLLVREKASQQLGFAPLASSRPNAAMGLSAADLAALDNFIISAAKASRTKTHHIEQNKECMRRRLMYSWNSLHDDDYSKGLATTEDYLKRTKEWFGVEAAQWDKDGGASVEVEYKRWNNHLKEMSKEEREALSSSDEWSSARSRATYPHLYKAALWHSSVAMSNVPVERIFAYMRKMEAFDRLTMDEDSFDYELFFKCNQWIVDEIYAEDRARIPAMKSGIDLFEREVHDFFSAR